MSYHLHALPEVQLDSLSCFIYDNCLNLDKTQLSSPDQILTKLKGHQSTLPDDFLFLWKANDDIQGVLYLHVEHSKFFLMNPGFIGQFPILKKDLDYVPSLSILLTEFIRVLHAQYPEISSFQYELSPKYVSIPQTRTLDEVFRGAGFTKFYSKMNLDLNAYTPGRTNADTSFCFEEYDPALREQLFSCDHQTFLHGDLAFFKDQSEKCWMNVQEIIPMINNVLPMIH